MIDQRVSCVGQAIGAFDQERLSILAGRQLRQKSLLASRSRRLWLLEGVGAAVDDVGHSRAELQSDPIKHRLSALILRSVMEYGCDRNVLIGIVSEDNRDDREQMGDVRDAAPIRGLSMLISVQV